jgi:hypothetical protein
VSDEAVLPCRSKGLDDQPCVKKRGHLPMKHSDGKGNRWHGGINTPAVAPVTPTPHKYVDNGYMTEADYQTWGRL